MIAYRCQCTPAEDKNMTTEQMNTHLSEVHKLDPKHLDGNSKMIMHMDCEDSFLSTYEITLVSGLKFYMYTETARKTKII